MSLFNHAGTIRVTIPGTAQEPPPKGDYRLTRQKTKEEFSYPRLTEQQVAAKHIRLLSGKIVQVQEASNQAFLRWYLAQLQQVTPNTSSYTHARQTLLKGINVTKLDMMTRWYLLEEITHLRSYANSGVKLFVDDEAGVA